MRDNALMVDTDYFESPDYDRSNRLKKLLPAKHNIPVAPTFPNTTKKLPFQMPGLSKSTAIV